MTAKEPDVHNDPKRARRHLRRNAIITAAGLIVTAAIGFHVPTRVIKATIAGLQCRGCSPTHRLERASFGFRRDIDYFPQMWKGTPTNAGEYPGIGAIVAAGDVRCTGTLISGSTVLTAAHCLSLDASKLEFRLGRDATRPDVIQKGVSAACFSRCADDVEPGVDLGVLYIEPITAPVATVLVADASDQSIFQGPLVVVGYGEDENHQSGIQQKGRLAIERVTDVTYETKDADVAVCFGDSGGPTLSAAGAVVGVTSQSYGCYGGIHKRVSESTARHWIDFNKRG